VWSHASILCTWSLAVRKFTSCTVFITNTLVTFTHILQNMSYKTYFFLFNNKPDTLFIQIYSVIKLYMFWATSLPIIRSLLLYIPCRLWWPLPSRVRMECKVCLNKTPFFWKCFSFGTGHVLLSLPVVKEQRLNKCEIACSINCWNLQTIDVLLQCLLSVPLVWSLQMSALLQRCRLEGHYSRTVERAMMQTEVFV